MTSYQYEVLGRERFQQFAQALIVAQHPNTQCLPVAQPDGGRDAFYVQESNPGFVVFQVKFSENPSSKHERQVVRDCIGSEKHKVAELVKAGAQRYYLITNVKGTAHHHSGSIDKAADELKSALGIPGQVWWRDDLDRRLDSIEHLKWSYPDILRATDIIPLLLETKTSTRDLSIIHRSLRAYVAKQQRDDHEIKFKQVDLTRSLIDLYVDLPIATKSSNSRRDTGRRTSSQSNPALSEYLAHLELYEDLELDEDFSYELHVPLAAAFFLRMPLVPGVTRFVLEGAPGQGKSTATQFVCQIHRIRLLNDPAMPSLIEQDYASGPVRTPFRVDLRDYAAWLGGKHPFGEVDSQVHRVVNHRSLESFLTMQVAWFSTSETFEHKDLLELFQRSHCVIVLDGFDEVADLAVRTEMVDEICDAAARLGATARSVQIIVTSRPAAFARSPGFPEAEWIHLRLTDLRLPNIAAYRDKWIDAQGLTDREAAPIGSTLSGKLNQSHIRDLARNPMQLAILLHLIHVQGEALPEKRTALYEEYMKLFFNREAEKSDVVRDRRELLLSIHGLLAWTLQSQAETSSGSGRITDQELRDEVKGYLAIQEHDPTLADQLLVGTFERIGALVARVQGTFEFEVQPLREYFAARYLYQTAPYSPAGNPRSGTRPERFHAMARQTYWTNVTRFFCGFYDIGELGSLVDGIVELGQSREYSLTSDAQDLALMLLSDHVFSQSPRAVKRLLTFITQNPGFRLLVAPISSLYARRIALPETAGRDLLFDGCALALRSECSRSVQRALRRIMAENASADKLKGFVIQQWKDHTPKEQVFDHALDFRILDRFDRSEIDAVAEDDPNVLCFWLLHAGKYDIVSNDSEMFAVAQRSLFDGNVAPWMHARHRPVGDLELLAHAIRPQVFAHIMSTVDESDTAYEYFPIGPSSTDQDPIRRTSARDPSNPGHDLTVFTQSILDSLKMPASEWRKKMSLWTNLVDRGFRIAPNSWLLTQVATISTTVDAGGDVAVWDNEGFSSTEGLVQRLAFARLRAEDTEWWRQRWSEVSGHPSICFVATLLCWCQREPLIELGTSIAETVESLSGTEWRKLALLLRLVSAAASSEQRPLSATDVETFGVESPRTSIALIDRVDGSQAKRRLGRMAFGGYSGTDSYVIRSAASFETAETEVGDFDWPYLVRLSKQARNAGLAGSLFSEAYRDWEIPEEIAVSVLGECESHCDQLVAICERKYGALLASRAKSVAEVAEEQQWFDPEQI